MEDSKLLSTLQELVNVISGHPPSDEDSSELWDIIENNALDEEDAIPSWLLDMLTALVEKRTAPVAQQTAAASKGGSVHNFLAELEDVIDMNWVEFGEYFVMQFPPIGLEAKVSIEDGTYEVRPIKDA